MYKKKEHNKTLYKVILVGVDHWHTDMHAQAAIHNGAMLLGVWGLDQYRSQAVAKHFDCPNFSSFEEALSQDADLWVIMGKPHEIAQRGLAALKARCPIIIEKPIGTCASDILPLIEAENEHNGFAAVALPHSIGMSQTYDNLPQKGVLSHMHFELINGPPQRYINDGVDWVLDKNIGGGGALRNLGIHGIQAFLSLVPNQKVTVLNAVLGKPIHGTSVEDYATVQLQSQNGAVATIEAGYTYASMSGSIFSWRVNCSQASFLDNGQELRLTQLPEGDVKHIKLTHLVNRYNDIYHNVFCAFKNKTRPAVSLQACFRAMALIDHCYVTKEVKKLWI